MRKDGVLPRQKYQIASLHMVISGEGRREGERGCMEGGMKGRREVERGREGGGSRGESGGERGEGGE